MIAAVRAVSVCGVALWLCCRAGTAMAQGEPVDAAPIASVAAEQAVRLVFTRVEGAESCPDEAQLRAAVHLHLGYPVFDRLPATRELMVSVRRVRSRFVARLELRSVTGDSMGARDLESRSNACDELAAALHLAIAVALDPTPLTRVTPPPTPDVTPEPEPCPAQTPCPQCSSVRDPTPVPPAAPDSALDWRLGGGVLLGVGELPTVALGAAVTAMLSVGALGFLLEGVVIPETTTTIDSLPLGMQVQLARVGVCGALWDGPQLRLALCGVAALGALRSASPIALERRSSLTSSAGTRLLGQGHVVGPLWLELRADLHANLVRTTVSLEQLPLWTTPALFVEFGLFGVVRFL